MEKILAILGRDVAYIHSLCDYMCNSHTLKYRIIPFVDVYDYLMFADERKVDVLLIDEIWVTEVGNAIPDQMFILSRIDTNNENELFMYQSMDQIFKKLCNCLSEFHETSVSSYKFKIITIMNLFDKYNNSSFAKSVALFYSRQQDVLFINFDPYEKDSSSNGFGLSELIYSLKTHADLWPNFTGKMVSKNRFFEFYSDVTSYEDILSLTGEDILNLFSGITKKQKYKTVIINIGMNFASEKVIFEKSEKVYFLNSEDEMINNEAKRQLKGIVGEEGIKKLQNISIPEELEIKRSRDIETIAGTKLCRYVEDILKFSEKSILNIPVKEEEPVVEEVREKGIVRRLIAMKDNK